MEENVPAPFRSGSVTKIRRNTMVLAREKRAEKRRKHLYALISLVIGFLLWFGIDLKRMEDFTLDVDLEFRQQIPADWELAADPPRTARIVLRGARQDIAAIQKTAVELDPDIPASAFSGDVSSYDGSISLQASQIRGLPPGVEVLAVTPESIPLRLTRIVTRPMTVVAGDIVGQPQEGYAVGKVQRIDPPAVTVSIPSRIAVKIGPSDVLRTKPIDVAGGRGLIGRMVGIEPFEKDGEQIEVPGYAYVMLELDEALIDRELPTPFEVRALIDSPFDRYGGLNLTPPSVKITVSGPKSAVDRLTQADIAVYADIRERIPAASGEFNLKCRAIAPANVRVARIDPDTVKWLERAH